MRKYLYLFSFFGCLSLALYVVSSPLDAIQTRNLNLIQSEKYYFQFDHPDINIKAKDKGVALYYSLPKKVLKNLRQDSVVVINANMNPNKDWQFTEMLGMVGVYPNIIDDYDDKTMKYHLIPLKDSEHEYFFKGLWAKLPNGDYVIKILVYYNPQKDITSEALKEISDNISVSAKFYITR
jgi:hypothetical protein